MSATVVLGAQFGDEGKGKLVDALLSTGKFSLVARCAGGHNAGHTLKINDITYDFHILPSGLIDASAVNLIGNGCVVSIPQVFKELKKLEDQGVNTANRIFISDRAEVLFNLHRRIDGLEERALGKDAIGTTGNGIGPCYSDKVGRRGCQMGLVLDKQAFDKRLRKLAQIHKSSFGELLDYDVEREIKEFDEFREKLRPLIVDGVTFVSDMQAKGKHIMVEGANALMLDIDFGTYPFVTSSNTGIAGVLSGLGGIRLESLVERIGVVKAYTTRVGSGPFPTEDFGQEGKQLQSVGKEFGTTTGRTRRTGPLDLVILRHSHSINRYTSLNLTKLDVLDGFAKIRVCTAYHCRDADGSVTTFTDRVPANLKLLNPDRLEVKYVELDGWMADISGARKWAELPRNAQAFVEFVEREVGVPVKWVGVGAGRDALVEKVD